jgi:hypothetical protein
MMHLVVTTDTAPNGELPSQAVPMGGINIEQLDLSTRQAAAYLFPKERGLLLLTLLFLQAEMQTLEIDGAGQVDVAIIRLQSVEVFARVHPGWSKDTTLRYITLLEALQILQRHRRAEYTEVHVPLIPWVPSKEALTALDDLLAPDAAREKLQQLASGVRARFLLLYGSPDSWPTLVDDLDGTLTDIQEVLGNRPSRTKRQLLQLRVTNLKVRLAGAAKQGDFHCEQCPHNGQSYTQKGDFYSGQGTHHRQNDAQKGDFYPGLDPHSILDDAQKGDFRSGSSQMNGSRAAQKGDFQDVPESRNGAHAAQKGDFQSVRQGTNGHVPAQKGDFQSVRQGTNGHVPAQKGDFQETMPSGLTQKGDFQGQSVVVATQKGDFQGKAPLASLNDNVITIHNDSLEGDYGSDNDAGTDTLHQEPYPPHIAAKVGQKLALFLENSPENTGGFVTKCKLCSPVVVQAAVIDVLVHKAFPTIDPADDRGRPRNKASWFHDACKKYAQPGAHIPAFIQKWLRTDLYWQDLEAYWKEIADQLSEAETRYKRYMIAGAGSADLVRQWLRSEIEQQALDEALQSSVLSQEKQIQRAPQLLPSTSSVSNGTPLVSSHPAIQAQKTWMDENEAEILAEEILRDAGSLGVSKAVAKQEHGVYVVALTWGGSPVIMKTPQQWRTHLEQVRPMFENMQRKGESNGTTK